MCVVFCAVEKHIPQEMLIAGHEKNDHGAGIAFLHNKQVKWIKGLKDDVEVAEKLYEWKVEPPYIVHFRIRSSGSLCKELTHPFPVTKKVTLDLEGHANKVLFHNGTWNMWDDRMRDFCMMRGIDCPSGEWNDSRAMAWLMAHTGPNIFPMVLGSAYNSNRIVTFDQTGMFEWFGSWHEKDGIMCSNLHWEPKKQTAQPAQTQPAQANLPTPLTVVETVGQAYEIKEIAPNQHVMVEKKPEPKTDWVSEMVGGKIFIDHRAGPTWTSEQRTKAALARPHGWTFATFDHCMFEAIGEVWPQCGDECGKCKAKGNFATSCHMIKEMQNQIDGTVIVPE